MGENRPKSENWAIWRPVAPQRCNRTSHRKVYRTSALTGPCTKTWSKQYLSAVHHVTCSLLWVRCLFDRFSIYNFGDKWSLKWKFTRCLSGFRNGTPKYVSWPNLVKIGGCKVAERLRGLLPNKKTRAPRDSSQRHFAPNGLIMPKIPWTLSPFNMST